MSLLDDIKDKAPEILKENKGALIGLAIGYLLTDSKAGQSSLLGAVAGSLLLDNKKQSAKKDDTKDEE